MERDPNQPLAAEITPDDAKPLDEEDVEHTAFEDDDLEDVDPLEDVSDLDPEQRP